MEEKEAVIQALAKVYTGAYAAHVAVGMADIAARKSAEVATVNFLGLLHQHDLNIEEK